MKIRWVVAVVAALGVALLPAAASAGTGWHITATLSPGSTSSFQSVSCTAANSCTAAGGSSGGTLAEHWNGSSWKTQPTANPSGAAIGSAASGGGIQAPALRISTSGGTRHVTVIGPTTPQFDGIKCMSSTSCIAVGDYFTSSGDGVTLAETWNGTTWKIQPTPNPPGAADSFLNGVACTKATSCFAVGTWNDASNVYPLIEHWNGVTWTIQPTPDLTATNGQTDGQMYSVSCTTASACTAAGFYFTGATDSALAERWNGKTWNLQAAANPDAFDEFFGIKCISSICEAVGYGGSVVLAEKWDGTSWNTQVTPNPPDGAIIALKSVSCASSSACMAVGLNSAVPFSVEATLAENWNGASWTIQATPNANGDDLLNGVSCTSATACMAVGDIVVSPGVTQTLAMARN